MLHTTYETRLKSFDTQKHRQIRRTYQALKRIALTSAILLGVIGIGIPGFADVDKFTTQYQSKSNLDIKSNTNPVTQDESYQMASGVANVIAKLGPIGYEVDPLTGIPKVSGKDDAKYRALYFAMSATPVFIPIRDVDEDKIHKIVNLSQDLKRFDTEIELIGLGEPQQVAQSWGEPSKDEKELGKQIANMEKIYFRVDVVRNSAGNPVGWAKARPILAHSYINTEKKEVSGEQIEVLAMLPNVTNATTEDNDLVKAAKIAAPVADILIGAADVAGGGLLPASSFGPKLKSTSGGLATIFDGLVPPKSVPTQFAFQQTPSTFGWYFRQNTRKPETASILGTHNGAVILRLRSDVKAIGIRARTLTIWRKPVLNDSPFDSTTSTQILTWAEPPAPNDKWILDRLKGQAVMLSRDQVREILSGVENSYISKEDLESLIHDPSRPDDKKLLIAAKGGGITKESVMVFLGLKAPLAAPSENKNQNVAQNQTMLIVPNTGQGTFLSP
jgi:hypothetical protein